MMYVYMHSSPWIKKALSPFCGFYACSVRFLLSLLLARRENSYLSATLIMLDPENRKKKTKKNRGKSGWKPPNGLKAFLIQGDDMYVCIYDVCVYALAALDQKSLKSVLWFLRVQCAVFAFSSAC